MTDSEIGMAMDLDQGRGLRHPFMVPMVRRRVVSARALIQKQKADAVVSGTTLSQLISARAEKASLLYVKPFAYSMPHMAQMRRTGFLPRETTVQRLIDESAARFFRNLVAMSSSANRRLVLDVSYTASHTDIEIIFPSAVYPLDADREPLPIIAAPRGGRT